MADSEQQPRNQEEELKFEDALARLENIVGKMEKGELSLQQMMQKFEEGMNLAKYCSNKLNETEKKIEMLMDKADGEAQWKEMEDSTPDTAQEQNIDSEGSSTEV